MAVTQVELHKDLVDWQGDGTKPYAYVVEDLNLNVPIYWTLVPEVADWLLERSLQRSDVRVTWQKKRTSGGHYVGVCLELPIEHALLFKLTWGGKC